MVNNQSQVYVMMIVLSVGFIIGAALAWWLVSRGRSEPSDPELDELKELRRRYTEQVSLWREATSGKLYVRMNGKMAAGAQQLGDNQRKFMNALLKEWLLWMGFPGPKPEPPLPAAPAPVSSAPAPAPTLEEARLAAATGRPEPPAQPPALEGQASTKPATEANKSIVEQIDAILQEKIKARLGFHKGVRIAEDRKDGVVVWIGLERFAGVDAVTDPEVKALLREAVQEWERQNQIGKK